MARLQTVAQCAVRRAKGAESRGTRVREREKVSTADENNLRRVFVCCLGRMKALQKNQGRTDQMLGAMADVLTSVAMPNQQWVSCRSVCVFTGCLYESIMAQNQKKAHMELF